MEDDRHETTPATDDIREEFARLRAQADAALFDRDLALERERRTAVEVRRLELRLSETRAEVAALQSRLDERERYLAAIHHSGGWRALQGIRGWLGRRW
jgi:chromosome segregation ATPase